MAPRVTSMEQARRRFGTWYIPGERYREIPPLGVAPIMDYYERLRWPDAVRVYNQDRLRYEEGANNAATISLVGGLFSKVASALGFVGSYGGPRFEPLSESLQGLPPDRIRDNWNRAVRWFGPGSIEPPLPNEDVSKLFPGAFQATRPAATPSIRLASASPTPLTSSLFDSTTAPSFPQSRNRPGGLVLSTPLSTRDSFTAATRISWPQSVNTTKPTSFPSSPLLGGHAGLSLFDSGSRQWLADRGRFASWNNFGMAPGGGLPRFTPGIERDLGLISRGRDAGFCPLTHQLRLFDPESRRHLGLSTGFGGLDFAPAGQADLRPVRLFDADSRMRMKLWSPMDSFGTSLGSSGGGWSGGGLRSLWDSASGLRSGAGSSFSSLLGGAFGGGGGGIRLSTSPSLASSFNAFPNTWMSNVSLSNPFSGGAGGGFLSGLGAGLR
jgi:hypothetical protein